MANREPIERDQIVYKLKTQTERIWDIATRLMIPIFLGIGTWAGGILQDHETRLTKMEVEIFTDEMAHELESRSASKSDVGEIKRLLERVDARVQAIDARTVRLETTMERNGK